MACPPSVSRSCTGVLEFLRKAQVFEAAAGLEKIFPQFSIRFHLLDSDAGEYFAMDPEYS